MNIIWVFYVDASDGLIRLIFGSVPGHETICDYQAALYVPIQIKYIRPWHKYYDGRALKVWVIRFCVRL